MVKRFNTTTRNLTIALSNIESDVYKRQSPNNTKILARVITLSNLCYRLAYLHTALVQLNARLPSCVSKNHQLDASGLKFV